MKAEMWKVHIISTETIKPSSPTPPHLSKIQLSLLDQLNRPHYIRFVLFYSNNGGRPLEKSHQLKKSLSETLSRFYPLAGRIEGDSSIECNDMGADFIEARELTVSLRSISECLISRQSRDSSLASLLTPGLVGMSFWQSKSTHSIAGDWRSASAYHTRSAMRPLRSCSSTGGPRRHVGLLMKRWSPLSSSLIKLIPPIEMPPSMQNSMPMEENLVTKCFVFDGSKIAALRTRAPSASHAGQPTRVETLSALIWRCIIKLRPSTASVAFHIVNLRRRMVPPLSGHLFGNFISIGATSPIIDGVGDGDMQRYLESELKDAIRKVDGNDIIKLRGLGGPQEILAFLKALSEKYSSQSGMDLCYFSSWCGIPIHDVDFGWGRSIWVSQVSNIIKNTVLLMDTRSGGGMETWICLEEEKMAQFEQDQELLSFASLLTVDVISTK